MKHCKNCDQPVSGSFCSHCGQKTNVSRITSGYFRHELFHFFTHIEKGFIYTTWQMVIRPGNTVMDFINGKRIRFQSPVSYFLIWTTLYILLLYLIEISFGQNRVINYRDYFGPQGATHFAISHLSLVLIIVIPFQALYLYLLIGFKKLNYFEWLACAFYIMGSIIFFQFVFAVLAMILFLLFHTTTELRISDLFKLAYIAWFTLSILKQFNANNKWIRGAAFIILALGTFTLWRLYGVPDLINLFMHHES